MSEITIIIVDDEIELKENLQDLLEFKNYTVHAYENGEAMLESLDSIDAGIVFLDYQLPGLTGIELIQLIHEKKPNLPVAIITASTQPQTLEAAMNAGADRIIAKPFTPQDIFDAVDDMLKNQAGAS